MKLCAFRSRVLAMTAIILSLPALAFDMVLGKQELSALLNLVFPYQSQIGQWEVRLSNPQPEFHAGQQSISLAVNVDVKEQHQTLKAWGKVGGTLKYDSHTRQLQLIKPQLLDFKVKQGNIEGLQPMVEELKANIRQQLPIIVLLDLQQLHPGMSAFNPTGVRVVDEGVALEF